MTSKQIHYVLTLAAAGTFATAADQLNISQPSLSQYIKKIEQQLGVELFERTGSSIRLTDSGRIFVESGRKILALENQMLEQFNDLAQYKSGSVVIGTSPYRSASMMPVIVKKFRDLYPGMHIVVEEMTTQELNQSAEHGQFDLCLTMLPINERLFSYEKIAEEEMIIAVPKDFPSIPACEMQGRKYPALSVEALDDMPFIMISEGQYMQRALDNLVIDHGVNFRKAAVVKSLEAQISMVRAGVGAALLPSGIERFCSPNEVTFYSLQQPLPKREVVVMWQKKRPLSKVISEMLRIMKEISW